ncbi:MAG: LysM peptidoglycan-binding domain-containing protein [Bacteroidota bacterium]
MRNQLIIFVFLLLCNFFLPVSFAQQTSPVVNRSQTIQTVNGKQYYFHAVQKGQTLFSIARAYDVSQETILKANPEVEEFGLKFDQMIRIPAVKEQNSQKPEKKVEATLISQTSDTIPPVQNKQPKPGILKEEIEETVFEQHRVKRRETVYGISRMYNISQQELLEHNPEARSGLKTNMVLRIPVKTKRVRNFIEYKVPQGQTLFSIAREFGVIVEDLEEMNPSLAEGLKAGQVIKIPYRQEVRPPFVPETDEVDSLIVQKETLKMDSYCDDPKLKNQYNIALLLPLYLDKFPGVAKDTDEESELKKNHPSFSFLDYYSGFLIALDSVRQQGVDIRLKVMDVTEDMNTAREAIRDPDITNIDLIIGPFYPEPLKMVANFARVNDIPVVSPLHWEDNVLLNRFPNLFQATPSIQTQINKMAEHIAREHIDENIVLIHSNQSGIKDLITGFHENLNDRINRRQYYQDSLNYAKLNGYFLQDVFVGERISNVYVYNDSLINTMRQDGQNGRSIKQQYMQRNSLPEFVYSHNSIDSLISILDTNRRNVLVSLMGNEALIANYTRQLNQLRDSFDITVYGVPQWNDYRSVEYTYLQNLNVHLFSPDFVDYNRQHVKDFVRRFRKRNHSEPAMLAFRGVIQGMFFLQSLKIYGPEFYKCIPVLNQNDSQLVPFLFEKPFGETSGWENHHVNIYKFENYQIKNINTGQSISNYKK